MTIEELEAFAADMVRLGHPAEYAALIGDVIEEDADGKWVVRKNGQIIDRIEPIPDDGN